jgi:hypothetical protein
MVSLLKILYGFENALTYFIGDLLRQSVVKPKRIKSIRQRIIKKVIELKRQGELLKWFGIS